MTHLDCRHDSGDFAQQVCVHLVGLSNFDDADFVKVFTGQGKTYRLACIVCQDREPDRIEWRSVCTACFAQIEAEGGWEGILGPLEIREATSTLRFAHRQVTEVHTDDAVSSDLIRQIQPISNAPGSTWIGVTTSGALVELQFDAQGVTRQPIVTLTASEVAVAGKLSLQCSADGRFIGVGETQTDRCAVYDRQASRFTLRVQSDRYRSEHTPYSLAFVQDGERTLFLHKTAWNRLDISDPATGALLTDRTLLTYQKGESLPSHYLNCFQGQLLVAPDQDFVADTGWVWHPVGMIRTWSSRRWREENVWESEDGPTLKRLTQRSYFWNDPICWIDNRTLAVWGYGNDDYWIIPAVSLYDVHSGELRDWFPGPEVGVKLPVPANKDTGWSVDGTLFFDRYLFATSKHHGTAVWNIKTGARLHQDKSFAPIAYHPATQEFLTLLPDGSFQLSQLVREEQALTN